MFDVEYFKQFLADQDELLANIESESLEKEIPIVGANLGKLLSVLVSISGPRDILELGTANGYSSLWMAKSAGFQGDITTIEHSEDMAQTARINIEEAELSSRIDVVVADAVNYLHENDLTFDMIFADIEKEHYSEILQDCVETLTSGGLLVCDNVAFESVGDFNEHLDEHPALETAFVYGNFFNHNPDEDAISLSFKKEQN